MTSFKLNRQQCQVIENLTDNILLMAPAGTGKTNTLALRIAKIIKNGKAQPEEILCLTFTNKACREMKERIGKVAGDCAAGVEVATIHSFCYRLLKAWAGKAAAGDIPGDFAVADEEDSGEILRQAAGGWDVPLQALVNFVSLVKEVRLKYDIFDSPDDRDAYRLAIELLRDRDRQRLRDATAVEENRYEPIERLAEIAPEAGAGLLCRYDMMMARSKLLDYNDLLIRCRQLLAADEVVERLRWNFISIDEAQDLSEVEYCLLSRIFGEAIILLAGDFFQTIYEWRGSNPTAVIEAFRRSRTPTEIAFTENYRATPLLVNAANDYLRELGGGSSVYPLIAAEAAADEAEGEPIILHEAESETDEARWIYDRLVSMKLTPEDYSRTAILTRSNKQNERLTLALETEGFKRGGEPIPFSLIDEFRFFRHSEIKDALAFIRLALRTGDDESCRRLARDYFPNIGQAAIDKLTAPEAAEAGLRLCDFFEPLTLSAGEPYKLLRGALVAGNVVVLDTETTGLDTGRDEVIQLAAIRIDDKGRELSRFMRFIRPSEGRSVGDSVNTHGFTDEFLAEKGGEAAEVFRAFNEFSAGAVLVGHNVYFDLAILQSHFARAGVEQATAAAVYDTLDIFRRFYPELKNHKLGTIGEFIQVKHASTHDAFDDICATAECLIFALEKKIIPLAARREALVEKYRKLTEKAAMMIGGLRQAARKERPCGLVNYIATVCGLKKHCEAMDKRDDRSRHLSNLRHLYLKAQEDDEPFLSPQAAAEAFLRQAALSAGNMEAMLKKRPRIPVITIHQAKGMEFDRVFLAGASDNQFPTYNVTKLREGPEKKKKLGEEARLFYVAITRAKKSLTISWPGVAYSGRRTQPSRFIGGLSGKYTKNA
ncbi:MAG: 3'-5' exonuclease [Selenomonadaceae bacterium]|nr:3'-5' exonuclease [Selenomonadaceae bacterium]